MTQLLLSIYILMNTVKNYTTIHLQLNEIDVSEVVTLLTLVSVTLRARTVFKIFLKERSQFRRTGLLCNSKLVHLDGKNLTRFIQNLVQNLMNLILSSKSNRKWPKMA